MNKIVWFDNAKVSAVVSLGDDEWEMTKWRMYHSWAALSNDVVKGRAWQIRVDERKPV